MKTIVFILSVASLNMFSIARAQECPAGDTGNCDTLSYAIPDSGNYNPEDSAFIAAFMQHASLAASVQNATPYVLAYPNPANDVLNLKMNFNIVGQVNACIYDMEGRVLDQISLNIPIQLITFEVGDLPQGLYFFEVVNNGNVIRDKFVKN